MIFMIRTISNPTNQTAMHTSDIQAATPARRTNIFSPTRSLLHIALTALLMLCYATIANAQWTDSNTGVTFTPTSGTDGYSGENWNLGCDGSTSTKHGGASNASPWYMVLQASEEVKLTGYTITTANDNSSNPGRSPYSWQVQGSNDGSNWTTIVTVTNDNTIQNVNYTEYEFSCTTNNYYTYFRFYITAINGGNYMQYSEFHPIGTVRPLEPGTSGGGGSTGPTSVGYVITNGTYYLGGTSTTAIDTFNPQTCLWTGTSGGTWKNSAGYYLRYYLGLTLNASSTSNWTLSGTENGNTGQKINQTGQNNRYIRYNNGWTTSNSGNATNAVFAVTKTTYNASYTVPAIGGATEITSLGSNNINTIATNAAYTQKYYDYIFRNGAHHYVDDDDATYLGSTDNDKPKASTFSYEWSLEGADGYATIDKDNGIITYSNSTSSDLDVTVKLTATSTKKTFVVTKTVTLKPVRIYYQINATANPQAGGKVYAGTSSGTPANATATISGNVLGSYPNTDFQPYLIASANDGYEFKWWSTTSDGTSVSNDATYRPTLTLSQNSLTQQTADTRNYYAQFGQKPTFYFSATATASQGGTASVDPSTANVTGEHWNTTSATKSVTFTASANSGYEFVGWYTDNSYSSDPVSTSASYATSITSTSTNSDSPYNTTLYARFEAKPTFYFAAEAIASQGGTASATVANSSVLGQNWNSTQATTSATFTAQVSTGYEFVGWYSDASYNTQVSTNLSYTTNITSTSTNSGSPAKTTLYARFEPIPTFYFAARAEVIGEGSASATVTDSSKPGAHWDSQSATTTATFTATTSAASQQFRGWSETPTGNIISTQNTLTVNDFASTSKDPSNPTTLVRYAHFLTIPTAISTSEESLTICNGESGLFTFSLTPEDALDNVVVTSGNTNIATVTTNGHYVTVTAVASGTTTITLSAKDSFGQEACNTTVSVTVPTAWDAPTISFNNTNNTVTISQSNAIIYYTTDGSTPEERAEHRYSAPFTQNTPTTIKAFAVGNGKCASTVTSFDLLQVATPTIEISTSGVTFSGATAEATYYYNLAGSNPTTEWNGSAITTGFTDGDDIKVIAKKTGMINSEIVTKTYHPASGTSGTTVILNDLEDHSWSYYSDGTLPSELRSLNPVDVKITYFGNGEYNINTTNGPTPAGSTWTKNATTVKVGPDANYDTFVYYKTLERVDGSTNDNPTGMCAYTVIPNPFSVRPTNQYDTGDLNKYCGFYVWRIKDIKNGKIYTAAVDGSLKEKYDREVSTDVASKNLLYAGSTYYFKPDSEYGMEVELEALWARAYVVTTGNANSNTAITNQDVGYERNFVVLAQNQTYYFNGGNNQNPRITQTGRSATISRYYPDGTIGNANAKVRGTNNITLGNDTKFEYLEFSNMGSATLNAAGHELVVGRGVTGTVNNLYGLSAASTTSFDMRIESGTYTNLYFLGQGYNFTGDAVLTTILGCDYDRAMVNSGNTSYNQLLSVTADIALGKNSTAGNQNNKGAEIFNCTVKSGDFDLGTDTYGKDVQFYLSVWGSNPVMYGKRTLTIEGGIFSDISGGTEDDGTTTVKMIDLRIKGGTMNSAVYGAAQKSEAEGHRRMIITGGLFKGWIAGGANGNATGDSYNGELTGNTYLYVGGNAKVNSGNNTVINRAVGGNVFAAGCGYGSGYSSGLVTGITNVAIADNAYIERGVYGGGSYGYTTQTSNIYILGGTIDCKDGGANGTSYLAAIDGGVYGGACQNQGGTVNITMKGGTVNGSVYGGSNYTGTLSGTSTVKMYGGTINGSLYGGGNGEGSSSTNVTGAVAVKVYGGTITGAVYGCNNNQGAPQSTVKVDIYGTDPAPLPDTYALAAVFGGGNQADYAGKPVVKVHNCDNSIEYVYGGGNAATVRGTDVTIYGGNKIGNVFGGCYGANVTNNGGTDVKIYGGTIGRVFGGNNQSGSISGSISVTINKQGDTDTDGSSDPCLMRIGEVYSGGNVAGSAAGTISIGCTGDLMAEHSTHPENIGTTLEGIGYVYGGANQAAISTDIAVNINSGIVANVFGGNNTSGTISGGITVNIEKDNSATCASNWYVGNVFGGGNLAPYSIPANKALAVNIKNGTVSGNVFGGGKGLDSDHDKGKVTGNPVVTIGDNTSGHEGYVATITGDVYGGGDAGNVVGTTQVKVVNKCNTTISGNVYGGGNAADVSATNVTIDGGNIGMVFGGGHGNKNVAPQKAANVTNNVNLSITGGTISKVFGGSNSMGSIGGTITLGVNKGANSCDLNIDELYGGGNEAAGNAGNITIGCTGGSTEGIGDVYGGANAADINNSISLEITGGNINRVFGGNNSSGNISGTIGVNVNWNTTDPCGYNHLGSVFGGGNQAPYTGTTTVTVTSGTVSESVYGGGNEAGVGTAIVNMEGGSVLQGIYGGCNNSGTVTGDITISLTDGEVGVNGGTTADVFGGGFGANTSTTGNISVTLEGTDVYGDLYGGSALGSVNASTSNTTTINISSNTLHGTIYGGGKGDLASLNGEGESSHSNVTANSNGNVRINYNTANTNLAGLYGGANINGLVKGNIEVNVIANVGASGDGNDIDIFGGGYGAATNTNGNVTVNIGNLATTNNPNPVIYGAVYGGSALGNVNDAAADLTTVNILSGTVNGNVYGGGLGDRASLGTGHSNVAAKVNGAVIVNIGDLDDSGATPVYSGFATINGSVYGCNNTNGSPQDNVTVNVYKTGHDAKNLATYTGNDATYAIDQVFGGGNQADYSPADGKKATVHVYTCDNTIRRVFGGGNAAAALGVVTTIDGGRFDYIFGGGNGEVTAANIGAGGTNLTVNSGVINHLFGGSNAQGTINGTMGVVINNTGCTENIKEFFAGGNLAEIGTSANPVNLSTTIACGTNFGAVYGGSNLADIYGNVTLTINGGTIGEVYAGSKGRSSTSDPTNSTPKAADIYGNTTLNIYGGDIGDAFGGSNINGNIKGSITVNMDWSQAPSGCNSASDLHITNVFGASNLATYTPTTPGNYPAVNIKHGTVSGSVFGAGNGDPADATKGVVTSNPVVTIGDAVAGHYAVVAGNVYGGGNNAAVTGNTTVTYNDNNASSTVYKLFGGGNAASVSGTTSVTLTSGKVTGGVYGGCNSTGSVGAVTVNLDGGQVGATGAGNSADIYGGGYGSSTTTTDKVDVIINGTTVYGDIYGGSALGGVNDAVGEITKVWLKSGTINGSLYGGGLGRLAKAAVGTEGQEGYEPAVTAVEAIVNGTVQVVVDGGSVTGAVYGCNNYNGTPKGPVSVAINNTAASTGSGNSKVYALRAVYGGGNLAHYIPTDATTSYPTVTVACGTSVQDVYGGGNAAAVPRTNVVINGGDIDRVFAGGNGESGTPANVGYKNTDSNPSSGSYGAGTANAQIKGGTINKIFGGSNANGVIRESGQFSIAKSTEQGACPMIIGEVYGGGNEAAGAASAISIGCTGTGTGEGITTVYGGANAADVAGNISLTIEEGTIANVYGGNNTSGSISGTVTVTINKKANPCVWNIGNVFGGGNQAVYTAPTATNENPNAHNYPVVNIQNGTVSGDVFGGGYGNANDASKGVVNGNPQVTISGSGASVSGGVYGGGSLAPTNGNPVVTLTSGSTTNIFGGGKAANVNGAPTVNINGGSVSTGVYGGCDSQGTVSGAINVYVNGGTIGTNATNTANVHGGGYGNNTSTGDAVTVTIGNVAETSPTIWGDVYGGSGFGNVNDDVSEITKVWLKKGTINGNIFGGGLGQLAVAAHDNVPAVPAYAALVNGSVQVVVDGGTVTGAVFGANNLNGTPKGTVSVTINGTAASSGSGNSKVYALQAVYGGGNLAHYDPTDPSTSYPTVTVNGCGTSIKDVFGGGNAAAVPRTNVIINAGDIRRVFAGGNGTSGPAHVGYKSTDSNPSTGSYGAGTANAQIKGGTIIEVYGGSNANGIIRESGQLEIERPTNGDCDLKITDLYGGGNEAAGAASAISIKCTGTNTGEGITNVYGGANAATVTGNISLTIEEGHIDNVYGGNNNSGSINGTVTVNINSKANPCVWYVGNVFGGGNNAPYSNAGNYPAVNIKNGTVSGNVYGGGKGSGASVSANPTVTIGDTESGHVASVLGNVFGGGDAASVTGNTTVLLTAGTIGNGTIGDGELGNIYGGGKRAEVDGNTTVKIEGGTVTTDVYGGGMQGDVTGDVTVYIGKQGSTVTPTIGRDVYGGGALANTNTANITGKDSNNNDIYNVGTGSKKTEVYLYPGPTIGHDVYGGGRGQKTGNGLTAIEAIVCGAVTVYQHGAILTAAYNSEGLATSGRIFGGNNVNGSPKGHILVYVDRTTGKTGQERPSDPEDLKSTTVTYNYDLAAVYGGGNEAEYNPYEANPNSPQQFAKVHIDGCNDVSIHSVYGGGNAASTPATMVTISGAYEIGYVFGGGNGAGTGNPGANVGYHAYADAIADAAHISDRASYQYGTGEATTNIYGGRIHYIYGGSNTKGNVRRTAVAMLDEISTCPLVVDGIYGGGREAYMEGKAMLEMGCVTGMDEIYGGSEKADVGSSVELTITSGNFHKVFGGNNKGGRIFGSITVNIEQTGCVPITIDELYLGGNNAPYSVYGYKNQTYQVDLNGETVIHDELNKPGDCERKYNQPVLNIRSFESIGTVYGGGNGSLATMVADPTVDINVTTGWVNGEYVGSAYPEAYRGKPGELTTDGVIGTVFGGGNAAEVIGRTTVNIGDKVGTPVQLKSMQELYDEVGTKGKLKGTITVTRNSTTGITYTPATGTALTKGISQTVNGATITGNIYGGGNAADVTGGTNIQVGPANAGSSPAPERTEQPAAAQPATQAPVQPQNAATESQQSRTVTTNRQ